MKKLLFTISMLFILNSIHSQSPNKIVPLNELDLNEWLIKLFSIDNSNLYDVLLSKGYTRYTDDFLKSWEDRYQTYYVNPLDQHHFADTTKKYFLYIAKFNFTYYFLNSWSNNDTKARQNVIELNFKSNSKDYLILLKKLESSSDFVEQTPDENLKSAFDVKSFFTSKVKTNAFNSNKSKYFFMFQINTINNEKGIIKNYSVILCENFD
ncbi:MAG: hypothetical protein WCH34_02810 [Bacteroidota bacterium]